MVGGVENITKYYNGNIILDNVTLMIEDTDKIGLIGVNGCGKTTLLRLIMGEEAFDKDRFGNGSIFLSKNITIGYLRQNSGLDKDSKVFEEMRTAFSKLLEVGKQIRELEKKMSVLDNHLSLEYEQTENEYARLTAYFEANDGYLIDVKIRTVLNGMGFGRDKDDAVISTLSGGEKTRLALAKLLLEEPNLLILDEPTNHLDFRTIMWLEDYLCGYRKALLVVSHDRYFLDKVCTSIAEIEQHKLTRYKGNYSAFTLQKEMNIERQQKEYEQQQEEIAKLEDYIAKNRTRASTAASTQGRIKKLEKIELIEKPSVTLKKPVIRFIQTVEPEKDVLKVNEIDIVAGEDNLLCGCVDVGVRRGDKLAVIGENGCGKSTLLKILQNRIPHSKGRIEWGKNVKVSYFDQENAQLNTEKSIIDELHDRYPSFTDGEVRTLLGKVRLVGENVFKPISVISGGERAKLCFAIMMQEMGNVLILDEPTNHLDLTTKEVLEAAMAEFEGTEIFVSHDRYLLKKVATRVLEIESGKAVYYDCGFEEYLERKKAAEAAAEAALNAEKSKAEEKPEKKEYRTKEQRSNDAKNRLRMKEIEARIAELEELSKKTAEEIADPQVAADYKLLEEKCALLEDTKAEIGALEEEWLSIS